MKRIKQCFFWLEEFLYYAFITLVTGTLVGAAAFFIIGGLFSEKSIFFLIGKGALVGFKYSGIWAFAIGVVMCIIKAKKMYGKEEHEAFFK